MGIWNSFKTDEVLERDGIRLDYGDDTRIYIARAGGANKRFAKTLTNVTRPYRRAIATETISVGKAQELNMEVLAKSVVLNWETLVDGEWQKGILDQSGKLQPVSVETILATFKALPDLFHDVQEQSQKAALFREQVKEEDSGN